MKLDFQALLNEANNQANLAIVGNPAMHEGWDRERMKAFARLVVEQCALVAENYPKYGEATAEEIRQLLGDK